MLCNILVFCDAWVQNVSCFTLPLFLLQLCCRKGEQCFFLCLLSSYCAPAYLLSLSPVSKCIITLCTQFLVCRGEIFSVDTMGVADGLLELTLLVFILILSQMEWCGQEIHLCLM